MDKEYLKTARDLGTHLLDVQLRMCLDNAKDDRITLPLARTLIEGVVERMGEKDIPREDIEKLEEELTEYAYQMYREYCWRGEDESDEEFERAARSHFEQGYHDEFLS
jgi:hypothetical protein